jgi:hypothetical protein
MSKQIAIGNAQSRGRNTKTQPEKLTNGYIDPRSMLVALSQQDVTSLVVVGKNKRSPFVATNMRTSNVRDMDKLVKALMWAANNVARRKREMVEARRGR